MTRKKTRIVVTLCIIGGVLFNISLIGFGFLMMAAPWYKPTLLDFYSDDSNYINAKGQVDDINILHYDMASVLFEWIEEEGKERVSPEKSSLTYNFKGGERFEIYSPDIDKTIDAFDKINGIEISFICAPSFYKVEFRAPIVQISIGNQEILSYDDGKQALLDSLSHYPFSYLSV